ncbi:hypothetical protein AB7M17_008943 [Bradyrhizobium sp. USDA 377]
MIFESYPWKMELNRHLVLLRKWSKNAKTKRARFYLERAVFLSAFVLRKMMENRKLTDAVRDRSIHCEAFRPLRPLSDRVSRFSGSDADDYDMTKSETVTMSAFDLMSEIMHSYIFIHVLDDRNRVIEFLVNSYHKRDHRLLAIAKHDFERILDDAIQDQVTEMHTYVHPTSGKIIAEVKGRKRPRK